MVTFASATISSNSVSTVHMISTTCSLKRAVLDEVVVDDEEEEGRLLSTDWTKATKASGAKLPLLVQEERVEKRRVW